MRLLLITVISTVVLGLVWAFLYTRGLQAPIGEYKHPLFDIKKPWIGASWQLVQQKPEYSFQFAYFQLRKIPGEPLRVVGSGSQTAAELINNVTTPFLLIELMDNVENIDRELQELLPKSFEERVLFFSAHNILMRTMKESEPLWLLGSSAADITRLLILDAIYLLPAFSFRGDFLITPIKKDKRVFINTKIREEFTRRNTPIILGPFLNNSELTTALDFHPDGLLIDQEEQLPLVFHP